MTAVFCAVMWAPPFASTSMRVGENGGSIRSIDRYIYNDNNKEESSNSSIWGRCIYRKTLGCARAFGRMFGIYTSEHYVVTP